MMFYKNVNLLLICLTLVLKLIEPNIEISVMLLVILAINISYTLFKQIQIKN